jgi:hypothetical protein
MEIAPVVYESASVEDVRMGKRYTYCRATIHDDHIDVHDKRTGALLTVVTGSPGVPAPAVGTSQWTPVNDKDAHDNTVVVARVREHCGACTRSRATVVGSM